MFSFECFVAIFCVFVLLKEIVSIVGGNFLKSEVMSRIFRSE